jgi:phage regulator Rha-like protein
MRGQGEGRKQFFFEKKNQKTFLFLRLGFSGSKTRIFSSHGTNCFSIRPVKSNEG